MLVQQYLCRRLSGVHGDVHRGPNRAAAVPQWSRDRANSTSQLLVRYGPSLEADLGEDIKQLRQFRAPPRLHTRARGFLKDLGNSLIAKPGSTDELSGSRVA